MLALADDPVLWTVASAIAIGVLAFILGRLDVPFRAYHTRLCERFILGVPWGSLVVIFGLFFVYLVIQRGWWHWYSPVVVAFTAVSMWDPTGLLLAGFSHASPGHLRGNVTTTLVFAPIVEWIWGHYPRDRQSQRLTWTRRPVVRAVVLFPLGVAVIGIVAALFSWGPVIGFSVAVYALVGISLVHYPVLTLIALVTREAVRFAWRTLTHPVEFGRTTVRVVEPSWFGTAVQGHLVGLLLGVLVGLWLIRTYRETRPSPAMVFVATALTGTYLSIWGIWWILGSDQFVLFRAAGLLVVLAVATAVTLAVHPPSFGTDRYRRGAVLVIVIAVLGMGAVGIGLNLAVSEPPPGEPAHSVQDYDIYYGEQVPDGMVNVVDLEFLGLTTDVRTSGVIVVSEDRAVWRRTVSATELETHGHQRFHVGGIGWSEEVHAERRGWVPLGHAPVYHVWIGDGENAELAFESEDQPVRAVVENHTFELIAEDGGFHLNVSRDDTVESVPIPADGEAVPVQDVIIVRQGPEVIVTTGETAMPVATRERYE